MCYIKITFYKWEYCTSTYKFTYIKSLMVNAIQCNKPQTVAHGLSIPPETKRYHTLWLPYLTITISHTLNTKATGNSWIHYWFEPIILWYRVGLGNISNNFCQCLWMSTHQRNTLILEGLETCENNFQTSSNHSPSTVHVTQKIPHQTKKRSQDANGSIFYRSATVANGPASVRTWS